MGGAAGAAGGAVAGLRFPSCSGCRRAFEGCRGGRET